MKLSEQELRYLSHLEERERMWPVTRLGFLLLGVISIAIGMFMLRELEASDNPGINSLLFIPFFFLGLGGWSFGFVLNTWRGDIKVRLLLRLIREHQDKDAS